MPVVRLRLQNWRLPVSEREEKEMYRCKRCGSLTLFDLGEHLCDACEDSLQAEDDEAVERIIRAADLILRDEA